MNGRNCIGTGHLEAYRNCCRDCRRWRGEKAMKLAFLRLQKRYAVRISSGPMAERERQLWRDLMAASWDLWRARLAELAI